jgi:hypothetical protein
MVKCQESQIHVPIPVDVVGSAIRKNLLYQGG